MTGRKMLGATNPLASEPGTIRGDFSIDVGRNICHGSDSVESANREIALWCVDCRGQVGWGVWGLLLVWRDSVGFVRSLPGTSVSPILTLSTPYERKHRKQVP